MNKSTVLNLNRLHIKDYLGKNKSLLLFSLLFVIGVISGTILFINNSFVSSLAKSSFTDYFAVRRNSAFLKIIVSSFFSSVYSFLIAYFCGSSLLGVLAVPILIFVEGGTVGALISYVYYTYSIKGIAYNAIILLPHTVIVLVALLFAAKDSFFFSLKFLKLTLPKNRPLNLFADFKEYCLKFLIYVLIILIASIVDAVICHNFIVYFEF